MTVLTEYHVIGCFELVLVKEKAIGMPRKVLLEAIKVVYPDIIHDKSELDLATILNRLVANKELARHKGMIYMRGLRYKNLMERVGSYVTKLEKSMVKKEVCSG